MLRRTNGTHRIASSRLVFQQLANTFPRNDPLAPKSPGSLVGCTRPESEARRYCAEWSRHYAPKYDRCLNMLEIEIGAKSQWLAAALPPVSNSNRKSPHKSPIRVRVRDQKAAAKTGCACPAFASF